MGAVGEHVQRLQRGVRERNVHARVHRLRQELHGQRHEQGRAVRRGSAADMGCVGGVGLLPGQWQPHTASTLH